MPLDPKMRVLVVDDFSTMRRITRNILKQLGINDIVEAEDGDDALRKLKQEKVDLIISDWNMPNLSGYDLLVRVRADETLKDIPFLMVTAEGQQQNILDAVKAGVSNYVVKPFTHDVLRAKLEKIYK